MNKVHDIDNDSHLCKIKPFSFIIVFGPGKSFMYICICLAVTDRQIREAAKEGARTLKDLRRDLGVASECGRCAACARSCLRAAHEVLDRQRPPANDPFVPLYPMSAAVI
jgi:bacterioferritin-associated ferredoxin